MGTTVRVHMNNFRIFLAVRTTRYRIFTFILTYLVYTSYHLSRKPISVVKSVLHRNCTGHNETNSSCGSWAPFDGDNSTELLGSLDTAFLFAYAIGIFISGHIAERMNLRIFLGFGMLGAGLFTAMFGVGRYLNIHSLSYYICIQIVAGLFEATGWPSVVACMGNWFGKGKRGLIMGIWNSHTSVGNILGSVIAAAFVEWNWGLSFIVPGGIIAFLGVVVLISLRPHPRDVGCELPDHEGKEERHRVADDFDPENNELHNGEVDRDYQGIVNEYCEKEEEPLLPSPTAVPQHEQEAISIVAALKIPGVVEFSLCLFFAKLVSYTFLFWLPNYINQAAHYSASTSADLSTVFDFGGILGGILAGVVSDVTGGRATTCAVMLFLAAPALFLYQLLGTINLPANVVGLLICGALVNGPYALITTAVSADLGTHRTLKGNAKALSTVTSIIDGTGSIGAAIGPLLTGILSGSNGWKNVFYMLIASDVIALLFLIRLVAKEVGGWCRPSQASL